MNRIFLISLLCLFIACGNDRNENPLHDDPEPAKPTELQAELLPNAIRLTWKKADAASTYQLFRQSATQENSLIGTSSALQFDDTNVVDGVMYEYSIRGVGPGDPLGPGLLGPKSEALSVAFCKPKLELVGNPDKTLDFGTDRMTLTLTFKNCGGGTIHWEIPGEIPAVRFTPSKGTVGKDPVSVKAEADRSGCEPKRFESTTQIRGNAGEPIELKVKMEIANRPILSVEPEVVELSCPGEGKDIIIGNTGTGAFAWRMAGGADWLTVTPRDGTVKCGEPVTVRLQALETNALPGTDSVDLRVSGASQVLASRSIGEKSIVVTLHLPEPEVDIRPNRVELTEENNWTAEVTLTNTGECALSWEAIPTQPWLVVEPKTGRLNPGVSQRLRLRGTPDSLDAGEYDAKLRFTFSGRQQDGVDVMLRRTGVLRGRFMNIFTRRGIPRVEITVENVCTTFTDNNGDFECPYEREGIYPWTASHPDFLGSEGTVRTARATGEIGTLTLIPIPQVAGDVAPGFGFDTPWTIALRPDEGQACIVNRDGGFIAMVDTAINRVVETIEVGRMPLGAVYADGELFVAVNWDNTIRVIDPFQRRVIATIEEVRGLPAYLAACRGQLYVTLQDNIAGNSVAVIDIATRRVGRRIPAGRFPHGVAVDPLCRALYVANHDGDSLSRIDLNAGVELTIPVGPNPQGVAISPDGKSVYTADAGRISRVDADKQVVVERFSQPGARFGWVAVVQLPDGKGDLVYATDTRAHRVFMWHPESGKFASINVGVAPFGIAVTKDGRKVYVCEAEENRVQWLENR